MLEVVGIVCLLDSGCDGECSWLLGFSGCGIRVVMGVDGFMIDGFIGEGY